MGFFQLIATEVRWYKKHLSFGFIYTRELGGAHNTHIRA